MKKFHFPSISSTNSWSKEHAAQFDPTQLTIVTADEQTAGRGRFKRSWVSPKDCNLYITYTFFIDRLDANVGNLPQVLALSAHELLQEKLQSIRIKWPNDLVIGKKKLAGILCEVTEVAPQWAVVIGIGINVNTPRSILEGIDRPATSLSEELGNPLDRQLLAEELHIKFNTFLKCFLQTGFAPLLVNFKKALIHQPGDTIQFHDFQKIITGTFLDLNDDGSLNLKLPNGSIKRCDSGELF